MRLCNVWNQEEPRVAVKDVARDGVRLLPSRWKGNSIASTDDLWPILADSEATLELVRDAEEPLLGLDQVTMRPPVLRPSKVLCVGLNYRRHALETGAAIPTVPVIFNKFPSSLAADGEPIAIPPATQQLDYEAELVMVIGRRAEHVKPENYAHYVAGYTVGNDVSARDLQLRTSQWLLGKSSKGFAPMGPYLVTSDEVPEPNQLAIRSWRNETLCQDSNTADMIFSCSEIIAYLSTIWTLEPGDVIYTGTPEGVILGQPESEQSWIRANDVVRVEIEGLGALSNRFL